MDVCKDVLCVGVCVYDGCALVYVKVCVGIFMYVRVYGGVCVYVRVCCDVM